MATTYIKSLHVNKGKTVAQTIFDRTDYAKNSEKTAKGELVTGYECDPFTVDAEFLLSKRQYLAMTGREQGNKDVLAYHIRQAFKPGEITAEDANRIGYELAMKFTKGQHQFIVATHIDKAHIHNHIVFNSTSIDCAKKFRDFMGSGRTVRKISDILCIENGLSIIEKPKKSKTQYGKWLAEADGFSEKKKASWQNQLCTTIDDIFLNKNPNDLSTFIKAMCNAGYEVKKGKYLAFRATGQKRFTRLRSLQIGYKDEDIIDRLADKNGTVAAKTERAFLPKSYASDTTIKFSLLIDIQSSIKAKNSPGYEQWAKIFNLKQAAQTLIFLQENNLTDLEKLKNETQNAVEDFNKLSDEIKAKDKRLKDISNLQKTVSNYSKTRQTYVDYKKSGYSKKFYTEHEGDMILHQAAKKAFDELNVKKIPTIKSLKEEYATVLVEKKIIYKSYNQTKQKMKDYTSAKSNAERLLGYSDKEKDTKRTKNTR